MEYVLTTDKLCKRYRHFTALQGLSMHVPKGAVYGFVGRNGAGKTTLIRQICGLQSPTAGSYTLYGVRNSEPGIRRMRRRLGAVVETPSIYLGMSAAENLRQQCRILGLPDEKSIPELLELVGLENTGKKKARHFSLGMRQRLGIAVALCGGPDFLLLDEPNNGLDPQGIIEIRELLLRLNREQGITLLISSHILDELHRVATHYGFLDHGAMVREMSAAELEAACRKCSRATVTDCRALCRVLDRMGVEFQVVSDTEADLYGNFELTALVQALGREGCRLVSLRERDETLESYYMNLLGNGGAHDA